MVLTQFLELWNNDNPQMLVHTSGSTGKPKPLWVDKCRMEAYSCPALLRIPLCHLVLRIRGYHPLWHSFPGDSPHTQCTTARSYNPSDALPQRWFGLFPGRSPLLGESLLFSFPEGTKMFQFPSLASCLAG